MTFPSESTIKVNGQWITLVADEIPDMTVEEFEKLYEIDMSAEGMLKSFRKAMEALAARQAELN